MCEAVSTTPYCLKKRGYYTLSHAARKLPHLFNTLMGSLILQEIVRYSLLFFEAQSKVFIETDIFRLTII